MTSVEKMAALLDEAKSKVTGDRNRAYGDPVDNHERTAEAWLWYLRHRCIEYTAQGCRLNLDARDVTNLNILQKLSRECHSRQHDTLVDIAGFAANGAACSPHPLEIANIAYADTAT